MYSIERRALIGFIGGYRKMDRARTRIKRKAVGIAYGLACKLTDASIKLERKVIEL